MSANSFMMPTDMSDLCRVCLQLPEESQYLDLTTIYDEEDNLTYGECFTICTQIDLSAGEGLPHHLCKQCGLELQMSYDFHKKIEDSKRIVEQYQMKIKVQQANITEVPATSRQPNNLNINEEEKGTTLDLIEEKYVISEGQLTAQLEGTEDDCSMHDENDQKYLNDQADEIDILNNMCNANIKLEHQIPSHKMEDMNENDEDHLELDDYQNVEALEEEAKKTTISPITSSADQNVAQFVIAEITSNEHLQTDAVSSSETADKFACKVCHKTFETTKYLNSHMNLHDENRKRFVCPVEQCGRVYTSKQSCHMHYKRSHLKERLPCKICKKTFTAEKSLVVHMRYHKNEFKYQCNLCDQQFVQNSYLTRHIKVKHNNFRYICTEPNCGKMYRNSGSLRVHRYTHTSMPFKCKHCEKQYAERCRLARHTFREHGIKYSQEDLDKMRQFTNSSTTQGGDYSHNVEENAGDQTATEPTTSSKTSEGNGKSLDTGTDHTQNVKNSEIKPIDVNMAPFVKTEIMSHDDCSQSYNIGSSEIGEKFTATKDTTSPKISEGNGKSLDTITDHTQNETNSEIITADEKNIASFVKTEITSNDHSQTYDEGSSAIEEKFTATTAATSPKTSADTGKEFDTVTDHTHSVKKSEINTADQTLTQFVKTEITSNASSEIEEKFTATKAPTSLKNSEINTADQNVEQFVITEITSNDHSQTYDVGSSETAEKFVCEFCIKTFSSIKKLNYHMRKHDKNCKTFVCPIEQCGRTYSSKRSYDTHYKQNHLDAGMPCRICKKIFASKKSLALHMHYHTKNSYQCNLCEKIFFQKCHLTRHTEVIHNNLRYICTEQDCGKVYRNSVSLRIHRYSHSTMPFKCKHCEKPYPQKSRLANHILHKHGIKYSLNDLEEMRQFRTLYTRHSYVRLPGEEYDHNVEESTDTNDTDADVGK